MASAGQAAVAGGSGAAVAVAADPAGQMATYRSYVALLADTNAKDENKLKAAQEISDNFEVCARGGDTAGVLTYCCGEGC